MAAPRQPVRTERAPRPIGPYEQAIRAGGFVFLSGQIAIDPATGKMVGGDAAAQARRVLQNLKAVLEAAGISFQHLVKVNIYLADMTDFAHVNEVYAEYVGEAKPARAAVAVKALPAGALVEMEAIAVDAAG